MKNTFAGRIGGLSVMGAAYGVSYKREVWVESLALGKSYGKAGFTLIELLVVVLIIGILAGVALPQYKTAVEKSRAAEAFINGRHLAEAEELFYLANGEYTDDWDSLGEEKPKSSNYRFTLDKTTYNILVQQDRISTLHLRFFMRHVDSAFAGKYLCVTKPDVEEGVRICKSLSGNAAAQNYTHMPGYAAYALN